MLDIISLKKLIYLKQMFNQTDDTDGSMPPQGGSVGKKIGLAVVVLLLLGSAGSAGYFYKEYDALKKNPNKAAQDETRSTIDAVAKLIVLPTGEEPTIATVTDPSKLKGQVFFNNAKAGDKVLIYTNAKKAILYSPADNKIVEVAPVNIGNTASTDSTDTVSGSTTENTDGN
jgi:hypothetical protein